MLHLSNRIVFNPEFNQLTNANDVGMVRASTVFVLSARITTIALGSAAVGSNAQARVAGWGFTSTIGPMSDSLQTLHTATITNTDCRLRLGLLAGTVFDHKVCTFVRFGQGVCIGGA